MRPSVGCLIVIWSLGRFVVGWLEKISQHSFAFLHTVIRLQNKAQNKAKISRPYLYCWAGIMRPPGYCRKSICVTDRWTNHRVACTWLKMSIEQVTETSLSGARVATSLFFFFLSLFLFPPSIWQRREFPINTILAWLLIPKKEKRSLIWQNYQWKARVSGEYIGALWHSASSHEIWYSQPRL